MAAVLVTYPALSRRSEVGARQHVGRRVAPWRSPIDYQIIVDTEEDGRRLDLLHTNVRRFGTIFNAVARATKLEGLIRRKTEPS